MSNESALGEFISECEEIIQRVSTSLETLEKSGNESADIDGLYRDIHTMKGSAQLFGFVEIGRIAHAIEASLGPVRRLKCSISGPLIEAIYKSLDLIDRMVKAARVGNPQGEFGSEVAVLIPQLADAAILQFGDSSFVVRDSMVLAGEGAQGTMSEIRRNQETAKPKTENVEKSVQPDNSEPADHTGVALSDVKKDQALSTALDSTIRVPVGLLDRLMNLVGELVLVRNQVIQYLNKNDDLEFLNLSQNLDVVTSELQSEVMRTRMQPIGNVVAKFQRVVRDLGRELGKNIDLTIQGAETELDKTLLESIRDPLTHIVRNSCDHGVETTVERKKAGKPETGHILIRAYHEGGQVVIEVSDDGKGLDKDRIVAKAVERGLIKPEQSKSLSEANIFRLFVESSG